MTDENREAQASLYVLGALPAEEVREFQTVLRGDLKLQLLLAQLSDAADAMVAAFPRVEPPPALKQRILAAIDQRLAVVANAGATNVGAASWQGWLPWIMTAGFAVLCVMLIFLGQSFRQQTASLLQQVGDLKEQSAQFQAQRDALQTQLDQLNTNYAQLSSDFQKQAAQKAADLQQQKSDLQKQLDQHSADSERQLTALQRRLTQSAADKDRLSVQLADAWASLNKDPFATMGMTPLKPTADAPPKALAASIWDTGQQKGMLVAEGLSVLPASRTYQIWVFDAKAPTTAINAGLFNVDEQGAARIQFTRLATRVENISRVLISTEGRGGAAAPTKVLFSSN